MKERNKEWYHDPTAERAISKVDRERNKNIIHRRHENMLMYKIGELSCFQKILEYFRK